eukprot:12219117-Alexandrium_andersonii.AAC.1
MEAAMWACGHVPGLTSMPKTQAHKHTCSQMRARAYADERMRRRAAHLVSCALLVGSGEVRCWACRSGECVGRPVLHWLGLGG